MKKPLLLLLLFAHSLAFLPANFSAAQQHNSLLLPALLGAHENLARVPVSSPSLSDPFSFAYVRALSAHPSVSSKISSAQNTSILWSWGEAHASRISQETSFDERCAKGKTTLRAKEEAAGDFSAFFSLENSPLQARRLQIPSNAYFPLPFSQEELDGAPISGQSLPNISVRISGSIFVPYEKTEEKNLYECSTTCSKSGCATLCGCRKRTIVSHALFSRAVSHSRNFTLENRQPVFFILSPILLEQLSTGDKFSIASFSNRNFAAANFSSPSPSFASLRSYSLLFDPQYGFAYVQSENSPSRQENFSFSYFSFSCAQNATQMLQLTGENSSLLYACIAKYEGIALQPGLRNSSLTLYDDFSTAYEFSFSSLSRNFAFAPPSPSAVRVSVGNLTHRPASEISILAAHRNADFSLQFQSAWQLALILLLTLSLWRFLR